jgi:hypothetical protein
MESWYDPETRTVSIAPNAPLYIRFHEEAHKEQHESGAVCFWLWVRLCRVRVVRYFVSLWVEFDAHRRARKAMERLGLWNQEACNLGRKNLMSYVTLKEVE